MHRIDTSLRHTSNRSFHYNIYLERNIDRESCAMSDRNVSVDVGNTAEGSVDDSTRRWASTVVNSFETTNTPPRKQVNSTAAAATTSKKKKLDYPRRETIIPTNPDTISKKLGYIVEEFKCNHNNFQGILYAGPLGLVFLGRFLLFEWTVVLKWEDVVKVSKKHPPPGNNSSSSRGGGNNEQKQQQQADPANNGVRIETRGGGTNPHRYDFERFFDAPKAYAVLASLHNDSILDLTHTVIPTPRVVSRGLRRMNSDPLRITNLFNFDDLPLGVEQDGPVAEELRVKAGMGGGPLKDDGTSKDARRDVTEFSNVGLADGASPHVFGRASSYTFSGNGRFDGDKISGDTDEAASENACKNIEVARGQSAIRKMDGADLTSEWLQVFCDMSEYKEQVIKDRDLKCTLDQFVETFVQDNAKHSIVEFMVETGEVDVHVSEWKDDADGLAKSRTIEYTHPVDVPMAPPMARARKEQTYRHYGDHGLIFETKTFVSDVPMTDCFYVADVMIVESRDDGKRLSLNMHFDIRFVKSTMFQSLIARTTKGEFEKFFQRLANFVAKNLGDVTSLPVAGPTGVPAQTPRPPSVVASPWSQVATTLIVLVLLIQSWILMDVRSVKLELRQMAAEMAISRQQAAVCLSDLAKDQSNSGELTQD